MLTGLFDGLKPTVYLIYFSEQDLRKEGVSKEILRGPQLLTQNGDDWNGEWQQGDDIDSNETCIEGVYKI